MLYMIVERFKNPALIYERFRQRGRMMPEGLSYKASWIDENLRLCFQLMETEDRMFINQWIANWNDLMDFEVYPVITSEEAAIKATASRTSQ